MQTLLGSLDPQQNDEESERLKLQLRLLVHSMDRCIIIFSQYQQKQEAKALVSCANIKEKVLLSVATTAFSPITSHKKLRLL